MSEKDPSHPSEHTSSEAISNATTGSSESWFPDHLGENFKMRTLELGQDPDGETDVVATLVRYNPQDDHGEQPLKAPRPAILYTHGMSDYFFQSHVAEKFHEQGFDFYALDLRKCGRSWREGQSFHYVSDLRLYFEELNQALEIISQDHTSVIPMGHSTGGLILALWTDDLRRNHKTRHSFIKGVIFNSPWLDLMAPRLATAALLPILNALGKKYPHTVFPVGGLGVYGQSVHRDEQGYWDFNTQWKPILGQRKYLGWMRSILLSQRQIHQRKVDCGVPTITLTSDKSYKGRQFGPEAQTSDSVLWVEQTLRWAPILSRNATVRTIQDALHDVFLSGENARNQAFAACFSWLDSLMNPWLAKP